MFRNLAANLVLHERVETTDAKAKELRRIAERLVSKALRLGDSLTIDVGKLKTAKEREQVIARRMHAQRLVASFLPKTMAATRKDGTVEDVDLVFKLFHEIAPRYVDRVKAGKGGGYTRITKALLRRGDNAPMSVIEFLPVEGAKPIVASTAAPKATDVSLEPASPKAKKSVQEPKSEKEASTKAAPRSKATAPRKAAPSGKQAPGRPTQKRRTTQSSD